MKCFAIVLILISVGGSFCDEEEESCRQKVVRICHPRAPPDFPQSPEEFLSSCLYVQDALRCLADVRETCDQGDEKRFTRYIRSFLDYLESMCVEDNPTFEAISSNLQCIDRVIKAQGEDPCPLSEKNNEILNAHVSPYLEDGKKDIHKCLVASLETLCESVKFGYHCGDDVQGAVSEVSSYFTLQTEFCTPEYLEELEPIREAYEALLIEELSLQDTLERKRK